MGVGCGRMLFGRDARFKGARLRAHLGSSHSNRQASEREARRIVIAHYPTGRRETNEGSTHIGNLATGTDGESIEADVRAAARETNKSAENEDVVVHVPIMRSALNTCTI